jgi:hypothetical protein
LWIKLIELIIIVVGRKLINACKQLNFTKKSIKIVFKKVKPKLEQPKKTKAIIEEERGPSTHCAAMASSEATKSGLKSSRCRSCAWGLFSFAYFSFWTSKKKSKDVSTGFCFTPIAVN